MNNELRGLLPSFGVTFCHIFATAAALYHPPPFHCYPFVVPQRRTIIPIGVASSYKGVGMSRDKRVESLKVRRSQATPVSLALLVLSAQGALADDAVQSKPAVLSEVVVSDMSIDPLGLDQKQRTGSRLDLTPRETPASVTVIDREVFEQRGAQNTQEILRGVPGITSSAAPGSPGALFYRGFSGGSVTQLFNGITVQYDVIAARPVDSWIYDRVEAVGGPSSFLYGAGAVGGSINYITKLANRDGNLTEAKARYGSYNDSQLAAGTNQKLGESNYVRIDVNGTKIDGWSDGTERKAWQAAASWLADLTPQLSSTVALEYQYENVDQPYWGTPVLRPFVGEIGIDNRTRFKNYNSQDGLYKQTVKWGRWILDYRVDDTLRFRNTLYHYDALRDYQNVETYTFNANNSRVVRSNALLQRHDQDLNGNRLEANWNSEIGGLPSNWVAGLDYSVNKQTRYPLSIAGPFGSVNPTNFVTEPFFSLPGMTQTYNPDRTNRVQTLALFAENRTFLTQQLSLLTALRWDNIDLEVTNHRTPTATNPAYFEQRYKPLTGRAGLIYDLTPAANVYVQYSTAADPPAGILTTASFAQGQDFDLTTGRQVEVGSKLSFDEGRGSATLALYDITRKNLAMADPSRPGTTVPVGEQSSRGIELAATWLMTNNFRMSGNWSLVHAQFEEFVENVGGVAVSRAGNRPTNIPKQVGNLWLAYTPIPSLELGGDLRYVSSRYADTANTVSDADYTVLGAYATYTIDKRTRLTARIKNLTDTVYAESFSGSSMVYLGAPRMVDVSIQTAF